MVRHVALGGRFLSPPRISFPAALYFLGYLMKKMVMGGPTGKWKAEVLRRKEVKVKGLNVLRVRWLSGKLSGREALVPAEYTRKVK